MKKSKKYLVLFIMALLVSLGIPAMEVSATEARADVEISQTVRTGVLGTNGNIRWTYESGPKRLTITGEDSGLSEGSYSPFKRICSDVETIVVKNCKLEGSIAYLFCDLKKLTTVEFKKVDTSMVTDMSSMFSGCSSLSSLDVSSFDTSNVTSMDYMFYNCSSLSSLDVSAFDTSNVLNMDYMFYNCSSLSSLDVSGFDTSNVLNMDYMFYNCSSLSSLDVRGFDTSKVKRMCSMFSGCSSLSSLDVRGFDTSNVEYIRSMFSSCSSLSSLDVRGFDTSNVVSMEAMFAGCKSLKSLDVSGFNTSNTTSMASMFTGCSSLSSLDVSGFDTSNVTSMASMFYGCMSLKSLDVRGFDTSNVTDMVFMFSSCSSLSSLDVSKFDTSNVVNMGSMFYYCSSLPRLDLSKFDTANVTNMYAMFSGCSSLKELNLRGFDTSNVTNMGWMFQGCSALPGIDLSGFNTSNVTDMWNMFAGCKSLKSLDVRGFNTSNVTDMDSMFSGCSSLKELNLRGFDTSNVTDMDAMFSGCSSLTSLDLSTFNLSKVKSVFDMLKANSLKSIYTPKVVPAGVTVSMPGVFKDEQGMRHYEMSYHESNMLLTRKAIGIVCQEELGVGESVQMLVKLDDELQDVSTNKNYMWLAAPKEVVTVSATGVLKAVGLGTATIRVSGEDSSVVPYTFTITVTGKTVITSQPTNQSVEERSNAVFKVEANGSNLSYQWQFKAAGANTWTNSGMTGSKTNSITVQGTAARNGYQYRCVITDGNGNKVTSNGATLNVVPAVTITSQPASQNVTKGANAVFKVTATGNKLSYQWQFRTSASGTWKNSGMTGATTDSITVQGTAARNGYQYRCVVTDGNGNKVTSNGAILTVAAAIAITGQPKSQNVTKGANAVFKVTATGSKLSYQWQFRTSASGTWKNSGMTGATTDSITVQGTAARNGYQYRCVITDGSGNKVTSNGATLTVASVLTITSQPASQSVAKGASAVFKVEASGSKLSYQWQVKTSSESGWTNSGMTGAKTNSITVQGTAVRNGYQYRCVITDGNGNKVTSNGATLTVK